MHNIRELIHLSSGYLKKRGVVNARREAEELLAALLKKKRMELYFDYDAPLEEGEVVKYRDWIRRKGEKEPLEYITGVIEFFDCYLSVHPGILIPRQETEILATLALKEIPQEAKTLWDLCTGSGCLGLSMKKKRPDLEVTLSDLSETALVCARKNAERNGLEVSVLQGDLLKPFAGKKADVVFCNPPYVTEEEYQGLEDSVRLYEPKEALVGGVCFYERLAHELPSYLNPHAKVFLEMGATQGEALKEIFDQKHWKQKRCEKDWAGYDRFFFLEYQENFE
ncbi:MAG: peptide chain release factor N(5)-glutamine methyltransferase [Simkaniaceae bacterium]